MESARVCLVLYEAVAQEACGKAQRRALSHDADAGRRKARNRGNLCRREADDGVYIPRQQPAGGFGPRDHGGWQRDVRSRVRPPLTRYGGRASARPPFCGWFVVGLRLSSGFLGGLLVVGEWLLSESGGCGRRVPGASIFSRAPAAEPGAPVLWYNTLRQVQFPDRGVIDGRILRGCL